MSSAVATGRFEGLAHILPLRVYYEDTDAGGIVYHASFLRFAERGRTEMLRAVGVEQRRMLDNPGVGFAVMSASLDFKRPVLLDDAIQVRTRLIELAGASLRARQSIECRGRLSVDIRVRVACIDRRGRPARLPDFVTDALTPYIGGDGGSRPAARLTASSAASKGVSR